MCFKKRILVLLVLMLACASAASASVETPQNVILFIGDGMGFEQVKAANYYNGGSLSFELFPHQGEATTYAANAAVTDSAASATALATGYKVNNGVLSVARPANADYAYDSELPTSLEYWQARGKSVGLVSTVYVTHATPAGFGAHEYSRNNKSQIATDYLQQTRPNVLFGGGGNGMSEATATAAGYTVVLDRVSMQAIDTATETMVSGQFAGELPYEYDQSYDTLPHLSEMTSTALDILGNDPDGFFMMVEGGKIDWAGHSNHLQRNVFETIEFGNAVQMAVDWAAGRTDTLIVVTADHETGGLTVTGNNGAGAFPSVTWSTGGHTGVNVPVYAWGLNSHLVSGVMDNTEIYGLTVIPEPSSAAMIFLGVAMFALYVRRKHI